MTQPTSSRALPDPLVIGLLFVALYLATAPDSVNPDGLGYLKLLPHNFASGHLLFMPLFRWMTHVSGLSPLQAGRLLDALLGGTGLVLTYGIVWRLLADLEHARLSAAFAACGLGLSYGYWVEGADLEAYAAATVALLATVRLQLTYRAHPSAFRAAAVGVLLGIAVLCHLAHVLLSVFVAVSILHDARPRRRALAHATLALAVGGALALGSYAYAAFVVRHHDLPAALKWVRTAAHGFQDGGGIYRIADGVYGLAKALVYSPYLYEVDAPRLLGQFLLGLAPLIALAIWVFDRRAALRSWPFFARSIAAWVIPYGLLALFFFGSDSERWLFILPALWLVAARLLAESEHRVSIVGVVLAYFLIFNWSTGIGPAHRDPSIRLHAQAATHGLSSRDLLLFPGHSWDEYVSFYSASGPEPFPVVYYAARDGLPACFARLDGEVAAAEARGGRVFALRIFDEDEDDPRGFAELKQLGLDRAQLRARLRERFSSTPLPRVEGEPPVVRLDHWIACDKARAQGAAMKASVEYTVDLSARRAHLYAVEARFNLPSAGGTRFDLHLPIWTPGSYLVREFERHLQDLTCDDGDGGALAVTKTDKATWRVLAPLNGRVRVRYRIYAHDLTVRAAHLDDSHGFWNGAPLFLYVDALTKSPARVTVLLPDGWHATTALPADPEQPNTFLAESYDQLVDSPFEAGTHEVVPFVAEGVPHRLAIWGQVPKNRTELTSDITKIIAEASAIFGGVPYADYTFLLLSQPNSYGGLEHARSSTLLTTPFSFVAKKKYEEFLELVSHEFFHLWNVKRIHPAALGPFDYQREAYTRCLWVMEGVTSYYDRYLLVRAGLKSPKAYLEKLGEELGKIVQTPGRLRQSLEEASFDAWIKFYRPDENSVNSSISYYLKGGAVALLCDLEIRHRSEGQRSLDDVMRLLYQRFGVRGEGFPDTAVQGLFEEAAGFSLDAFFQRHVRGTEELDSERLLRTVGLELSRSTSEDPPGAWLGANIREEGDSAVISASLAGGPAEEAGLFAGDELVAIEGFRADAKALKERLSERKAGEVLTLTIFRRDQLKNLSVTLGAPPLDKIEVVAAKDASAEERAAFQRWLGHPLPEPT